MEYTKAQSAAEFMMVLGAVIFVFIGIFAILEERLGSNDIEKRYVALKEIALFLQDEIELAENSNGGYYRQFRLPYTTIEYNYNIELIEDYIYANTTDGKHVLILPSYEIMGQPVKEGFNNITKINGIIYLNDIPPSYQEYEEVMFSPEE